VSDRRILIVSGMSGAGKTSALRAFEDIGYYCVDNLPPPLMEACVDLCHRATPSLPRLALAIDARTGEFLEQFSPAWGGMKERSPRSLLLFFDAPDGVLVQRFSETRRPHPLAPKGSVSEGIQHERQVLLPLRNLADAVIDTGEFNVHSLREFLLKRFAEDEATALNVAVSSFAYRNGVLPNADLVFDVRFLPNPHYDSELRALTGLDDPVRAFVESSPSTVEFLEHMERLLSFLLPRYGEEGKTYLTLAFGCTGGRHRSVAVAGMVAEHLRERGYPTTLTHADLGDVAARRAAR